MNQTPLTPRNDTFRDLMRPAERIAALIYLPIHIVALPMVLPYLAYLSPQLSAVDINLIYYLTGFAYMLILCWRFLHASFNAALDAIGRFLMAILTAYLLELALSMILSSLLVVLGGADIYSPNNETITQMAPEGYNKLIAMTVFMAPIVEEILFRGLIFGSLRRRNRLAAWIVSVAIFSLYHIWQYAIDDPIYLISAVLYIPGSISLNWCYERSGSIWAPILYHMLTNAIGMGAI